jgi:hypothetical protein
MSNVSKILERHFFFLQWIGFWSGSPNPETRSAVRYRVGDVVKFGGQAYICINPHTSTVATRPDNDTGAIYWNISYVEGLLDVTGLDKVKCLREYAAFYTIT